MAALTSLSSLIFKFLFFSLMIIFLVILNMFFIWFIALTYEEMKNDVHEMVEDCRKEIKSKVRR